MNERKVVYICSPFSSDVKGNTKKARRYCRFAVEQGVIPIAPHLLFPQFMNEDTEREIAISMDLELLSRCDELWVFQEIKGINSPGMQKEIEKAGEMTIKYFLEEEVNVRR